MLDEDVHALLGEVGAIAGAIGDDTPASRWSHEHDVGTLFDRCRGMHGAVVLLLDNGFVHEAAALGRPLFVDSLALVEIAAADDTRRIEMLVGRQLAAIADVEGMFLDMQARGEEVAGNIEHMRERRAKVEAYARRHSVGTKHWEADKDIKKLAERHGRGDEYAGYRMTHHFVHGSAAVTEDRSWFDEEDVAHIGGPTTNLEVWEAPAAMLAAYSLALACRATCEILGYKEPDGLDDLIARIRATQEPND
jgi:hypothetical protein